MDRWKSRGRKSQGREENKREEKRKSQKKEDVAPEGRKVGSLKRRARRHLARCEMKTRRKSGRRCGAKHISKSKSTKHTSFEALLEVKMSEKCTLLWREAHFQVKMFKKLHVRTTFGRSDVFLRGRRKAFRTLPKVRKTVL